MIFRCKECQASVWLQPAHRKTRDISVACEKCDQVYNFKAWKLRNQEMLTDRARRAAAEHDLDLPSGYSLVLGLAACRLMGGEK